MKKSISPLILFLSGLGAGAMLAAKGENRIICRKQESAEKFRIMYQMMERWMQIKQEGRTIAEFFKVAGYHNIAIYGMGDIGQLLLQELNQTGITVLYGIDKSSDIKTSVPVYQPTQKLHNVDAVIVTAIAYYDEIEEMLSKTLKCPIVSMENIVWAQYCNDRST